jgi:hypothetical protein
MSSDVTDIIYSRTSSTAVGPRLVVISLVTLVILGLSRPNILFIFVKGLIADTSGRVKIHKSRDSSKTQSQGQEEDQK